MLQITQSCLTNKEKILAFLTEKSRDSGLQKRFDPTNNVMEEKRIIESVRTFSNKFLG